MLQMKNRLKYCSLAIVAARLFSSGPVKNPVVYLDIEADNEPLGRIIIEVTNVSLLTPASYNTFPGLASEATDRQGRMEGGMLSLH